MALSCFIFIYTSTGGVFSGVIYNIFLRERILSYKSEIWLCFLLYKEVFFYTMYAHLSLSSVFAEV